MFPKILLQKFLFILRILRETTIIRFIRSIRGQKFLNQFVYIHEHSCSKKILSFCEFCVRSPFHSAHSA